MDETEKIMVLESCALDKSSYAAICFEAMKELSENSYLVTDSESGDDKPILERNYILSMVFQMGKNAKDDSDFGTNVFPSGENNKYIYSHLEEIKKTYHDLYEKDLVISFEVIPDLVIHTSHNPKSGKCRSQFVAIEAKTTKNLGKVAFMRDLFKLNVYLCDLNYNNAIYLIVNTPKDKIEDLIRHYFNSSYFYKKYELGKLLFFIQENQKSPPAVYKLTEDYINTIKEK